MERLARRTIATPAGSADDLGRLGDEIAELAAHLAAATARLLDLIREFDARGSVLEDGLRVPAESDREAPAGGMHRRHAPAAGTGRRLATPEIRAIPSGRREAPAGPRGRTRRGDLERRRS